MPLPVVVLHGRAGWNQSNNHYAWANPPWPSVRRSRDLQARSSGVDMSKYSGRPAMLGDGRIVFAPRYAAYVGIFDPSTDTYHSVGNTANFGNGLFASAVSTEDGRVVLIPSYDAPSLGIVRSTASPALCNASNAPPHGELGDCAWFLESYSTCQPTCDEGYIVSGLSSCSLGTLTTATCRELTCCENTFVKFGFGVKHTYEEL